MTDPYITAERAVELVRWWAPRLGLGHWHINVIVSDDDPDKTGAAWISSEHDSATIVLAETPTAPAAGKPDSTNPHSAETTIVHELIHMANRHVHDEVQRIIWALPKARRKGAFSRYNRFHEGATERLARALVLTRHGMPDEMPVPVIEA